MKFYFAQTEEFLRWVWTDPEHRDYFVALLASLLYPLTLVLIFIVHRRHE